MSTRFSVFAACSQRFTTRSQNAETVCERLPQRVAFLVRAGLLASRRWVVFPAGFA
jgi:hypothetical protein